MAVLHALQVFGPRLAFGLAPGFNDRGFALRARLRLQGFELGLQAGLVSGQRFLEQLMPHCAKPRLRAPFGHVPIACLPASACGHLYAGNHLHLLQPLPGQAQHQDVKLRLGQRHRGHCIRQLARPGKAALVQAPGRAPHAKASLHEQLG